MKFHKLLIKNIKYSSITLYLTIRYTYDYLLVNSIESVINDMQDLICYHGLKCERTFFSIVAFTKFTTE